MWVIVQHVDWELVGVVVEVDEGKERGSEDSEPVRRCVDDGTAKVYSSRR